MIRTILPTRRLGFGREAVSLAGAARQVP